MKLIVLASSQTDVSGNDNAELYNSFNADINIVPGSTIALQSITTELAITETNTSGEAIYNPLEEFENYYVELIDLNIESYYGFVNEKIFNGSQKNIIGTLSRKNILPVFVPRADGSYTSPVLSPPGWSPIELTSALWLDAADVSTLTLDASNFVEVWADKSGEGNDVSQTTAASRPLYINPATGILFDDDYMTASFSMGSQPYTFYLVVEQDEFDGPPEFATNQTIVGTASAGTGRNFIFQPGFGSGVRLYAGSSLSSTTRLNVGSPTLVKCVANGSSSEIWVDDVLVESGNAGTIIYTGINLGCSKFLSNFFQGKIMELLIIPGLLSNDDNAYMNTYLIDKWNVSIALSSAAEDDFIYEPKFVGGGDAITKYTIDHVPNEPIFLNLMNKNNMALRNLSARLVKYDGSRVPIAGPMSINLLIKGPDE
tara:strand:+ start:88 stop:1371 length:1284 start_codon:yes stop_codon:yes gene_type:complete